MNIFIPVVIFPPDLTAGVGRNIFCWILNKSIKRVLAAC